MPVYVRDIGIEAPSVPGLPCSLEREARSSVWYAERKSVLRMARGCELCSVPPRPAPRPTDNKELIARRTRHTEPHFALRL